MDIYNIFCPLPCLPSICSHTGADDSHELIVEDQSQFQTEGTSESLAENWELSIDQSLAEPQQEIQETHSEEGAHKETEMSDSHSEESISAEQLYTSPMNSHHLSYTKPRDWQTVLATGIDTSYDAEGSEILEKALHQFETTRETQELAHEAAEKAEHLHTDQTSIGEEHHQRVSEQAIGHEHHVAEHPVAEHAHGAEGSATHKPTGHETTGHGHEHGGHEAGAHEGNEALKLGLEASVGVLASLGLLGGIRELRALKGELTVCREERDELREQLKLAANKDHTPHIKALHDMTQDKLSSLRADLAMHLVKMAAPAALLTALFVTTGPVAFGALGAYSLLSAIRSSIRAVKTSSQTFPEGSKEAIASKSMRNTMLSKAIIQSTAFAGCSLMFTAALVMGAPISLPLSTIGFGLFVSTLILPKVAGKISTMMGFKNPTKAMETWSARYRPEVNGLIDLNEVVFQNKDECKAKADELRKIKSNIQQLQSSLVGEEISKPVSYRLGNTALRTLEAFPQIGDFMPRSLSKRLYNSALFKKISSIIPGPEQSIRNRRKALYQTKVGMAHRNQAKEAYHDEQRLTILESIAKLNGASTQQQASASSATKLERTISILNKTGLAQDVLGYWGQTDHLTKDHDRTQLNSDAFKASDQPSLEKDLYIALDSFLLEHYLPEIRKQEASIRALQHYFPQSV